MVVHRRAGNAELQFLAGDVVDVRGELQLELLWLASSDDRCLMAGGPGGTDHDRKAIFEPLACLRIQQHATLNHSNTQGHFPAAAARLRFFLDVRWGLRLQPN